MRSLGGSSPRRGNLASCERHQYRVLAIVPSIAPRTLAVVNRSSHRSSLGQAWNSLGFSIARASPCARGGLVLALARGPGIIDVADPLLGQSRSHKYLSLINSAIEVEPAFIGGPGRVFNAPAMTEL